MKKIGAAFLFLFVSVVIVNAQAVDPGPRGGTVGAGGPIAGLNSQQQEFFANALARFNTHDTVQNSANIGLGPTFNSDSCGSCHSQPATGGSSPSTSAFPFIGDNPQVAVATLDGAQNVLPPFITANGPVREVRFKFALNPNGTVNTAVPDGGVHDLFVIGGRSDSFSCTTAVLPQPNFAQAVAENNAIFRIPTPTFGAGLIETISETTINANTVMNSAQKAALGIGGIANRSGNDGSITRFGWKAQNKSLEIFAGEAYNVEMGVTNELFPNERNAPPACQLNHTPEDATNFLSDGSVSAQVPSDTVQFAMFMRLLAAPTPAAPTQSTTNGLAQFTAVGCAFCHVPAMKTEASYFAPGALSYQTANLFSDLLIHHMGSGLSDGISQGAAGPDQFRTAPLWGVGQRAFFLHDGRTSDLVQAIQDHASTGSEANQVIKNFNALTTQQQQDLINFLRSL
jgi:CxxC motif-containing protein (DUF1111 family)